MDHPVAEWGDIERAVAAGITTVTLSITPSWSGLTESLRLLQRVKRKLPGMRVFGVFLRNGDGYVLSTKERMLTYFCMILGGNLGIDGIIVGTLTPQEGVDYRFLKIIVRLSARLNPTLEVRLNPACHAQNRERIIAAILKPRPISLSSATIEDCEAVYGLNLRHFRRLFDSPRTIHIPDDFPHPSVPEWISNYLHRALCSMILDSEASKRSFLDPLLFECIGEQSSTRDGVRLHHSTPLGEMSGRMHGFADYTIGSVGGEDTQLLVTEAKKLWNHDSIPQVLGGMSEVLEQRNSSGLNSPVFGVLTNAENFEFFALDTSKIVYTSGEPIQLDGLHREDGLNTRQLADVLRWMKNR
jgi:hypothetical protein